LENIEEKTCCNSRKRGVEKKNNMKLIENKFRKEKQIKIMSLEKNNNKRKKLSEKTKGKEVKDKEIKREGFEKKKK